MPRLIEYEAKAIELPPVDVAYLSEIVRASAAEIDEARLIESLTPTSRVGVYSVRSGPYVGRIGLPSGMVLDFVSRFAFLDALELIRRSARLPIRRDNLPVPSDPNDSIVDVIAAAFATAVERLVAGGIAKGYVDRRFDRRPYPGALDVTRHLSRFAGRPDRLATTARRITRNILVNRALLAGLSVLRHVPLSAQTELRLARLWPALGDVELEPLTADRVASISLSTLTTRYESALALVELLLRAQSLGPFGDAHTSVGIVFSMPKVWERYVFLALSERWSAPYEVVHGYDFKLSSDGLRAEADVFVSCAGKAVAVCDAKYKRIEHAPARPDLYQMVSYCERLGLDEASLVLPAPAPSRRSVRVGHRVVHVVGLPGPTSSASDPGQRGTS